MKGGGGVVPNYIPSLKLTKIDGWKTTKLSFLGVHDLFSRGKLLVLGRVSSSDIKHGWYRSMMVNGLMVSRFVSFLYLFICSIP